MTTTPRREPIPSTRRGTGRRFPGTGRREGGERTGGARDSWANSRCIHDSLVCGRGFAPSVTATCHQVCIDRLPIGMLIRDGVIEFVAVSQ